MTWQCLHPCIIVAQILWSAFWLDPRPAAGNGTHAFTTKEANKLGAYSAYTQWWKRDPILLFWSMNIIITQLIRTFWEHLITIIREASACYMWQATQRPSGTQNAENKRL